MGLPWWSSVLRQLPQQGVQFSYLVRGTKILHTTWCSKKKKNCLKDKERKTQLLKHISIHESDAISEIPHMSHSQGTFWELGF